MRLKPDGSLDYRPTPPSSRPAPARTAEELERMRDGLVEELLRGTPAAYTRGGEETDRHGLLAGTRTPAACRYRLGPVAFPPCLLLRPGRQSVEQLGIAVHAGAGQPDRQTMPVFIASPDHLQGHRDPVGRPIIPPTSLPPPAHHATASGNFVPAHRRAIWRGP